MKPVSIAPAYVAFYPLLADIARGHGYALTIHGSVSSDMDLVAVPWTEESEPVDKLVQAFSDYATKVMAAMFHGSVVLHGPEEKPHNRVAYTIQIGNGWAIDLSIIRPISKLPDFDSLSETDLQKLAVMILHGNDQQKLEALTIIGNHKK